LEKFQKFLLGFLEKVSGKRFWEKSAAVLDEMPLP
jgi:hypothetical protein